MAKLEELSELLVSEIRNFEEAVKRLEEIQKVKITIDIAELKMVLSEHLKSIKYQNKEVQDNLMKINNVIEKGKRFSNWTMIILIVSLVINFIIIIFSIV